MAAVDYYYYGTLVIAPVSIVLYNVLSGDGRGPSLYGVEPWTYYVKNGLLNLNIVLPLALVTLPGLVRHGQGAPHRTCTHGPQLRRPFVCSVYRWWRACSGGRASRRRASSS